MSGVRASMGAAVLAVALAGTSCARLATGGGDPAAVHSAQLVDVCALGVPGTRAALAEGPDGVHLFLSTVPAHVDELRARAREQAELHGPGAHRGRGHQGDHEGPRSHGLRLWSLGAIAVTAEDIPGGTRLVVTPDDPTRRAQVKDALARRIAELQAGGCGD